MSKGNRILIIGLCAAYAQSTSALAPVDVDPFDHLVDKSPQEIYDLIAVVDPQYKQGEYPAAIERYCADLELCMEVNGTDAAAFWLNQGRKPFTAKGSQLIDEMIREGAILRKGITYNQKVLQGRNSEPVPATDDEEPLIPVKPTTTEGVDPAGANEFTDEHDTEVENKDAEATAENTETPYTNMLANMHNMADAENAEPAKETAKNLKAKNK